MEVTQLVTFAILMGANNSIMSKSPDYILEKFEACSQVGSEPFLRQLLDKRNVAMFDAWLSVWVREWSK